MRDHTPTESDQLDPLARKLRAQARTRRAAAPDSLHASVLSAWRSEQRASSMVWKPARTPSRVTRVLTAAACLALVCGAAFLAQRDGRSSEPTPSASMVISTSLKAIPRSSQDVMRLASMPLRKEAQRLAQGPRRMLSGLDMLPLAHGNP